MPSPLPANKQDLSLRLFDSSVKELDRISARNGLTRREVIQALIAQEAAQLKDAPPLERDTRTK